MSTYQANQAYFNGFISSGRNVFLTSSVAIALFGYSSTFKIQSSINIVKICSIGILIFAILYGLNSVYGMQKYINFLKKSNTNIPQHVQLNIWQNFVILTTIYVILLIIILLLCVRRLINRIN